MKNRREECPDSFFIVEPTNYTPNANLLVPNEVCLSKKMKFSRYVAKVSKRWFIDAFTGMAQGLFVTLIAGTIIKEIGGALPESAFSQFLILLGKVASVLMGAAIGAGMAHYLKAPKLVILSAMFAGLIGAYSTEFLTGNMANITNVMSKGLPGNPVGAYIVALMSIEFSKLIAGKTKIDILLVPLFMMFISLVGIYCAIPAIKIIEYISKGILIATKATPFVMGILISVVMGILLTMPTSSAAIWVMIAGGANATNDTMLLAGGAAVVGCAAQMVGFAVLSFRENGFSGLISQGIGTSMLQIPNIMKHPIIFVPPIIASAIVGPMATTLFKLRCTFSGGGMGTSGFVGVIMTLKASNEAGLEPWMIYLGIILLMFVLPALICWVLGEIFRKKGWIKPQYLKLDYNN